MLSTLIASVLSGEASEMVGRSRRAILAYFLAASLVVVGTGFFVGAGYILFSRRIGAVEAALWFGGGALVMAIMIVTAHRISARMRARRIARRRKTEFRAVAGAAAMAALPTLLARKGGIALVAPALAAIAYAVWRENSRRHEDDSED